MSDTHQDRRPTRAFILPLIVALAIVLAAGAIFLGYTHDRSGVWLSAPLDDTFIHFQYAKQLARGRLLQFNDGDSPSTGATSLLYLFLLAPGWLVGFKGIHLLIWAWIVNGGLHILGGLSVFGIIYRLSQQRPLAFTGMIAFLINGPLLWGAFSQMEIALFSTLTLLTLWAALRLHQDHDRAASPAISWKDRHLRWVLIWGALLALTRPEGALMAGGLTLWLLWRHMGQRPQEITWPQHLWRGRALLAPLMSGVAMLLLFLILTGRLSTNAAIKSHLRFMMSKPTWYWETSIGWLPMTFTILLEKWPHVIRPIITALGLIGLGCWALGGRLRKPGPGMLALGWLILLTLFYAFTTARRDHFDRYYLPYFGLMTVAIWWSLSQLAQRLPSRTRGIVGCSCLILLFMLPDTLFWARRFGDNCRDLAHQHFKVAEWLRANTPAGARIAINDAGAIPYLTGLYSYDVVGLAHNAFYRRKTHMPHSNAPIWEAMESLPHPPDRVVAYPEWIRGIYDLPLFKEVKRFPLKNRTVVANETKIVWDLSWELLADGDHLPAANLDGKKTSDKLDIADLAREDKHRYERLDSGPPQGLIRQEQRGSRYLIDGGRHVHQGERFRLKASTGQPATLICRTHGPGPFDVVVRINGRAAGRWQTKLRPGLQLIDFPIPADLITTAQVTVQLEARRPYTSFYYWLVQ